MKRLSVKKHQNPRSHRISLCAGIQISTVELEFFSSISKYSCYRVYKIDCEFGSGFNGRSLGSTMRFKCWLEWKLLIFLRVSFVVTQTASELLVFFQLSLFHASLPHAHFYTQSHVLCIEMSLATHTQGRQCSHGHVSMIKFST